MKFTAMQAGVMSGSLGDLFWDLAPLIVYAAGYDLGCNIYVANPTDTAKEYALMARLSRNATIISDEAVPVFGHAWFKVEPGDFVTLKGALRFTESNADLTLSLVERESGEATDSVVTSLAEQTTSSLPPGWPGSGSGTGTTTIDWNSIMSGMMPALMFVMLGVVMVSAFKPNKEPEKLPAGRSS